MVVENKRLAAWNAMKTASEDEFLSWAAGLGVVPDERYAPPRCLVFSDGSRETRFWTLPRRRGDVRGFLSHLLSGLEPWSCCYVWPRGGCWHKSRPPRNRIEEDKALAACGGHVPDGFRGARVYSSKEREELLNLLEAQASTACCVRDDVFVLPDHATLLLHLDHHDVVHVECADAPSMERFIAHMADGGYPLPEELPDATFKGPDWMR